MRAVAPLIIHCMDDAFALLGMDGCRGGWVVARSRLDLAGLAFAGLAFECCPHIREVAETRLQRGQAVIAIDMPIGLPASGPRQADVEARKQLGPGQGSRVFPAPARCALHGTSYAECCALNRIAGGKALSRQTWRILPRIREVDAMLSPARQSVLYEVHPEVSFRVLNGAPLKFSKHTAEGQRERLEILRKYGIGFDPAQERMRLGRSRVKNDDLIDAAAALVTAARIAARTAMALGDEVDERGLRMQIWA